MGEYFKYRVSILSTCIKESVLWASCDVLTISRLCYLCTLRPLQSLRSVHASCGVSVDLVL